MSPDGARIVSTHQDATLRIWDSASGKALHILKGHTGIVFGCALSPDGTRIVSAGGDKALKIWDAATGRVLRTLTGHSGKVLWCAVSPDGTWIVSVSDDCTLRIWDIATGAERAMLVLSGSATAVAFHPSAAMVACGDTGGSVHLAHLVGIDLGSLVVTADIHDHHLSVRCPVCRQAFRIEKNRLGTEITCPQAGCNARLRANSFVVQRPREKNWFSRLLKK